MKVLEILAIVAVFSNAKRIYTTDVFCNAEYKSGIHSGLRGSPDSNRWSIPTEHIRELYPLTMLLLSSA